MNRRSVLTSLVLADGVLFFTSERSIRFFSIIVLSIAIFSQYGCQNNERYNRVTLHKDSLKSFAYNNVYINKIIDIEIDRDTTYILDHASNRIFKVDIEETVHDTIGNKSGPGSMHLPLSMHVTDNRIFVSDNKRNIVVYNKHGRFIKNISIPFILSDIVVIENKIYGLNTKISARKQFGDNSLVIIYDMKGNMIDKWGHHLDFESDKHLNVLANKGRIIRRDDNIFITNNYFPIVRKYNLEGDLIKRINLNKESYNDIGDSNANSIRNGSLAISYITTASAITDSTMILSDYRKDNDLHVSIFNMNGGLNTIVEMEGCERSNCRIMSMAYDTRDNSVGTFIGIRGEKNGLSILPD